MKFEDALAQMREGKKIRHPSFDDDIWFQACKVGFIYDIERAKEWPLSIVKMKGDREHPDMRPVYDPLNPECKHGNMPQINLFLLISDEWQVFE